MGPAVGLKVQTDDIHDAYVLNIICLLYTSDAADE